MSERCGCFRSTHYGQFTLIYSRMRRVRERITKLLALVIAKYDLGVGDFFDVVGIDGHLAPAARCIDHVLRYGVTLKCAPPVIRSIW